MEQKGTDKGHPSAGAESVPEAIPVVRYLKAARTQLRDGRLREAYSVMFSAFSAYPEHPLILSYYGWLQAVVDKRPRNGATHCRRAVANFKTSDKHIAESVYPILYLNLGRTLLLSGRKREAVETFRKGLTYDRWHRELRKEMTALGVRKQPVLPFLSRSNPLNKVLGRLRGTKAPRQGRAAGTS
jgi:hypothetical protein